MSDRPKLLYLDDEENNLFAMKALFRREYDIFTTTSAQEAVQYLNENEVPVILSDQKMPELSGVEFFELTVPDFPNAVRILVTGYADMEAVIDAINKGQVYRYVTKPWDENELRITISNALDKFNKEKELRLRTQQLEKANAELERFIYSASHDLRSPLVSIKGIIQVAQLEGPDEKTKVYMEMVGASVQKLDDFVQNIIHFYQNSKSDEIITEVHAEQLIDEVAQLLSRQSGAKEVNIIKEITSSGPFKSDAHRLKMVLSHLMSNAIKFRDINKQENTVSIHIVQNSEKAVIRVEDNGVGIHPKDIGSIFEMFYRNADQPTAVVGSGIGLYIAREAVLKMGGKIDVTSELGQFTRFTLDIPNKA